jgi:hypothetical protein
MDVYQLIGDVPEYKEFLTVQELSASSRDLARRHPSWSPCQTIGTSTEGRPIEMLTIGNGRRRRFCSARRTRTSRSARSRSSS